MVVILFIAADALIQSDVDGFQEMEPGVNALIFSHEIVLEQDVGNNQHKNNLHDFTVLHGGFPPQLSILSRLCHWVVEVCKYIHFHVHSAVIKREKDCNRNVPRDRNTSNVGKVTNALGACQCVPSDLKGNRSERKSVRSRSNAGIVQSRAKKGATIARERE